MTTEDTDTDTDLLTPEEAQNLSYKAGRAFSPTAPIDQIALFSGRVVQRTQLIDAVLQRGQHAILFGERGVGKTSLAGVLADMLRAVEGDPEKTITSHVMLTTCQSTDTFDTLWRRAVAESGIPTIERKPGFGREPEVRVQDVFAGIEKITPEDVRSRLTPIGEAGLLVLIFDEFDRLRRRDGKDLFAELVKTLSDHITPMTIVLVGIGGTVEELIAAHESVSRPLKQVRMPRMSLAELSEIVEKGLEYLGMTATPAAKAGIANLSNGLPHYTHVLAQEAARIALRARRRIITSEDGKAASLVAVDNVDEMISRSYHMATRSKRRSIFREVLAACALTTKDERGYFSAGAVRTHLIGILNKDISISTYAPHLSSFCDVKRGRVLERTGQPHSRFYRFRDPIMEPYVKLRGLKDGILVWK